MVSNLIYKVTGRMTNKKIVKTAEKIGTELIQRASKNGGEIQIKDIQDVLSLNIGKKKASRFIISDKLDEFIAFSKKYLGLDEELATSAFYGCRAAAVPGGGKTNKSFFKIDLSIFENLGDKVNTISHETEHLLFQTLSFRSLLEKMQIKILGKKWLQKFLDKYGNLMNEKNLQLQEILLERLNIGECATGFTKHQKSSNALLEQLNLNSRKEMEWELKEFIRYGVLLPSDSKTNLKILKTLRLLLKDESRAYKIGGKVEIKASPKTDKITKSEMFAQYYDETIKVLKQEIKHEQKNRIREIFGLSRKD
jgi:hypothetical protein